MAWRRSHHRWLTCWAVALLVVSATACSSPAGNDTATDREHVAQRSATTSWQEVDPPVGSYSMAPNLAVAGDQLHASWIERFENSAGETRHRLKMATLAAQGWSTPSTIAEGGDFFANWADLPALAIAEDGTLYAHWLAKTDEETYAYSILLARSIDGGKTWTHLGRLNDDDTPTEHGFVAYTAEGEGIRAFWLDGREMVEGKPMTLRTARIGETVGVSEVLAERVCECCGTDAALSDRGPVLVFRDRSDEEIRDIGVIRRDSGSWTATQRVHADNWEIPGCPVNGPAIAATGDTLVVVWYTASEDQPKVQASFSTDAGESFQAAHVIDEGRPLGRVDVVMDGSGAAVVSWLEGVDTGAEIRLRRVWQDGRSEESVAVARTTAARSSGFPRLARAADHFFLAWVETDGKAASHVRMRQAPVTAL